jgi:tetratricopeptide (TPR) repeat protein
MENKNKQSKSKLSKGMLFIYGACAAGLFIILGTVTFSIISTARLNSKLDAIRATGYPATLDELNDFYQAVPDIENAAKLYEKAFRIFHNTEDQIFRENKRDNIVTAADNSNVTQESFNNLIIFAGNAPTPIPGERLSKTSQAACQNFVVANRECIEILKQAANMPKCRFPSELKNGFIVDYAHLDKLNSKIKLLAISTILAAEAGNAKIAADNILAMLKICQIITEEPLTISYLVKIPLLSQTVQVLEYTLSMIKLDSDSMKRISQALECNLDGNNKLLDQAFAGSRVMSIEYERLAQFPDYKLKYHIARIAGIVPINKLKTIEIYGQLFTLDKNDIKAIKRYNDEFGKQLKAMSFIYFLTSSLIVNPTDIFYKNLTLKAQINGAIIALAVEIYRQKYHKLPEQLTQLVPEFIKKLPNDPFTGKSFHYVVGDIELPIDNYDNNNYSGRYKSSKIVGYSKDPVYCIKRPGWLVYSYGRDQDDDNGVPMGFLKPSLNGDIAFRCVRSEQVKSSK